MQRASTLLREEIAHTLMGSGRYRGWTAPLNYCTAGV